MFNWISQNSQALTVLTNVGTLLIWLVYAQLLYLGFRRQRRPRLIINRGKKKDIDALCIISNMSAEPVFIDYIIAELKTSAGTIKVDVTDFDQAYSEGDEEQGGSSGSPEPGPVGENTRQGPVGSGDFLHIGTFDDLLKRLAKSGGVELVGHRPQEEDIQFRSLTIRLIGVYGPEDMPVGAERSFDLIDNEHGCTLMPSTWDTKRLSSPLQRRRLRKEVTELNASNFTSSSTIKRASRDD